MPFTGFQIVSAVVLSIGTGLIVVAICTTNWSNYDYENPHANDENVNDINIALGDKTVPKYGRRGLWQTCQTSEITETVFTVDAPQTEETCEYRYKHFNGTIDEKIAHMASAYQAWEIAVFTLMLTSFLLGLIGVLTSPCCCNRCGACSAVIALLAALCATAGIGVYAYYQRERTVLASDKNAFVLSNQQFDYSFWCAVAGGACQYVASVFFFASRGRNQNYSHQI